jgi:ribosome biogenesis GTPase A
VTATASLARRERRLEIERRLSGVHVLIEVADARAPAATRDPVLTRGRFAALRRLLALSRSDLADPAVTSAWLAALGSGALAVDARSGAGRRAVLRALRQLRPSGEVRAMVVGLPNLGKSSLVNRLVGRASAAVGDRPGITRGEQWLRAAPWLLLRDEPGVLPASEEDWRLAALGVLAEGRYDPQAVAASLLAHPALRAAKARLRGDGTDDPEAVLAGLAVRWGAVLPGGRPDLRRAAVQLIGRFRAGGLGRISLEAPDAPER